MIAELKFDTSFHRNDGKSRKKVKLGRVLPHWGEGLPPNVSIYETLM